MNHLIYVGLTVSLSLFTFKLEIVIRIFYHDIELKGNLKEKSGQDSMVEDFCFKPGNSAWIYYTEYRIYYSCIK